MRPGELLAQALGGDRHRAAHAQARDVLLRHREVHVEGIDGLQRHDGVAGGEVLAEVDLPDAEDAGERRADLLAVDGGADLADPRLGLRVLGAGAVVVGLGHDALRRRRPRARSRFRRARSRCDSAAASCARSCRRVEADQHLAFAHRDGRSRR